VVSAAALYTPEVLALATSLAAFPLDDRLTLRGSARSPACGSTLELGLALDGEGRIFAGAATGQTRAELAATLAELEIWLEGSGAMPAWPGLEAIAAARSYPARHGAILLAWRAALGALPSGENAR
jgi:NifU-like protein involved in Fe-S cluster formation